MIYTILLYISPKCSASTNAREWLVKYDIAFTEKNINKTPLTLKELKTILKMSEEGLTILFSDTFKKRHASYLNSLTLKEALEFITLNTNLLKTPILIDDLRIVCGFDELEMNKFLPKKIKNVNTLYA